ALAVTWGGTEREALEAAAAAQIPSEVSEARRDAIAASPLLLGAGAFEAHGKHGLEPLLERTAEALRDVADDLPPVPSEAPEEWGLLARAVEGQNAALAARAGGDATGAAFLSLEARRLSHQAGFLLAW